MALGLLRLEFSHIIKQFAAMRDGRAADGEVITAVDDVSLSVEDGEVVSLIGPSG